MLIDGEEKKAGSILEDFDPAINPPEEIDDPEDSKPDDWVDTPKSVALPSVLHQLQLPPLLCMHNNAPISSTCNKHKYCCHLHIWAAAPDDLYSVAGSLGLHFPTAKLV